MSGPVERRERARLERNAPQETSQTPLLVDNESKTPPSQAPITYKCSHKPITMGRKIDFTFFENEGFNIGNKIKWMS